MARQRSMSDEEIGLAKAMLARGMRNDAVHFYFNRVDRLISSGRIAQIRAGKYGASVPATEPEALDQFIEETRRRVGGAGQPSAAAGGPRRRCLKPSAPAGAWWVAKPIRSNASARSASTRTTASARWSNQLQEWRTTRVAPSSSASSTVRWPLRV